MAWEAVAGGVGVLGDLAGTALQNAMSKNAQQRAMRFAKKMYQHRYQYTMQDLRAAGLNPVLAGQLGGGSAPGAPSYSAQAPALGSTAVQQTREAAIAREQLKNLKADRQLKEATTRKEDELQHKAFYDAHTSRADAQLRHIEADIATKYGPSAFGRAIGSGEMIGTSVKNWFRELLESPGTAKAAVKARKGLYQKIERSRARVSARERALEMRLRLAHERMTGE